MNAIVRPLLAAGAGAALIFVAGASAGAQSQNSTVAGPAQPQRTIQLVQAPASLDHTLDAKKAKQGEVVTAKLQKEVDIPQEQALPKDTVLEGHVDQVQPSQHKGDSTVVVTFDKAKLKGGQEVPIKATVLAIAEPAYLQSSPMAGGSGMPAGGGAPAAGGMPAGGAPAGGAPAGGAMPGGTAPNVPSQPMETPNQATSAPPNPQAQRNGVPGVLLQSDIHQQASATFTSQGKNVHLPDGTRMDIAVAVIPAGVRVQ